jgi:hypothetical protein
LFASRRPYPVATASASMRRTMLTNNRRVRWLSASISGVAQTYALFAFVCGFLPRRHCERCFA